ncbi:hypothetical protein skT53_10030 [Effusibacillus dendaii]|uniref:Uncharacterized protein n=1 Tax=Effusibacillus dendaii TaxID=2743772 RepID=A0A7I8D776_9BACL|nr:hypothetical protein skT53_10030 [Effusibacillus dendaii]
MNYTSLVIRRFDQIGSKFYSIKEIELVLSAAETKPIDDNPCITCFRLARFKKTDVKYTRIQVKELMEALNILPLTMIRFTAIDLELARPFSQDKDCLTVPLFR